jgi:hypothetical protein
MSYLKTIAAERIARQLENLGCSFKIITADGEEFGDLTVVTKSKRVPINATVNYVDQLKNIAIGESRVISYGELDAIKVQAAMCSFMHKTFGSGTYMTGLDRNAGTVEILRLE